MFHLRKPSRRTVHLAWLLIAALLAALISHGAFLVLFLGLFFVIWVVGYGVLVRYYR